MTSPPNHRPPSNGNRLELPRRLFHASGVVLLLVPYWLGARARLFFLVAAFLVTVLDLWRLKDPRAKEILGRVFGPLLRPQEKQRLSGTFFFFWGLALSFLLFGNRCASLGLLVLALADPLAGIAGTLCPRPAFLKKTLFGTLTFGLVAALIFGVAGFPWAKALWVGGLAALLENLSPLDDNFVLPVGVGALCRLGSLCC